jgi:prepilin-type processing-associated H-X9-DG protein
MYAQDYDETVPLCQIDDYAGLGQSHFPYWLLPYVKNAGIFNCPSMEWASYQYTGGNRYALRPCVPSYCQNVYLGSELGASVDPYPAVCLADIDKPAECPLHWDNGHGKIPLGYWTAKYLADLHNGQVNISWADGHVKSMSESAALANVEPYPYQPFP